MRKHRLVLTYNTAWCYNGAVIYSGRQEVGVKLKYIVSFCVIVSFVIGLISCVSNTGDVETVSQESRLECGRALDEIYILNTKSRKIHKATCGTASLMLPEKRQEFCGEIETLFDLGYTTCGNCFSQKSAAMEFPQPR